MRWRGLSAGSRVAVVTIAERAGPDRACPAQRIHENCQARDSPDAWSAVSSLEESRLRGRELLFGQQPFLAELRQTLQARELIAVTAGGRPRHMHLRAREHRLELADEI